MKIVSQRKYQADMMLGVIAGSAISTIGIYIATCATEKIRGAVAKRVPIKGMDEINNPCLTCQNMDPRGIPFCRCRMKQQDETMFQAWVHLPLDTKLEKLKEWGRTPQEAFIACDVLRKWESNGNELFPNVQFEQATASYATVRIMLEHMGY